MVGGGGAIGNDFVEFSDARGIAGGGVGGIDGAGLFVPRFDPAHFDPALLQQLIEQQQLQIAALQQQAQQQQALAQWPPPPPLSPHQDLPLSPAHSATAGGGSGGGAGGAAVEAFSLAGGDDAQERERREAVERGLGSEF